MLQKTWQNWKDKEDKIITIPSSTNDEFIIPLAPTIKPKKNLVNGNVMLLFSSKQ